MANKEHNPGWELLLAPFAWLAAKLLHQVFKNAWDKSPNVPYKNGHNRKADSNDENSI